MKKRIHSFISNRKEQKIEIAQLIQYKKITDTTVAPEQWSRDEKAKLVAYFDFKSDLAKEREGELELGLRTDDDINELVTSLEQM